MSAHARQRTRTASAALTALVALALVVPASSSAVVRGKWSGPEGAPAGVLVIHGGAWSMSGAGIVGSVQRQADAYASQGARVLNADHRPLRDALPDILDAYDALDAAVDGPICVVGDSSGGHLALNVAMRKPVACVIARGAPTDLLSLPADGAPRVAQAAVDAFGAAKLREVSPVHNAARLAATPVILSGLSTDRVVPFVQQQRLAAALPQSELVALDRGDAAHVHGRANANQLVALEDREHDLVARATLLPEYKRPSRTGIFEALSSVPLGLELAFGARIGKANARVPGARAVALNGLIVRQLIGRPGRLTWTLRLRGKTVARKHRRFPRPREARIHLKTTKRGKKLLLRAARRPLRLRLTTRLVMPGGSTVYRRARLK